MSYISAQMARHLGAASRVEENRDRAVTVRPSSTANFVVDSEDRTQYQGAGISGNFTINKPNSLFNGFFTRIALTEIVVDWCIPNVSEGTNNNQISITTTAGPTTIVITIPDGNYTTAEVLDLLVSLLNAPGPAGFGPNTFRLEDVTGAVYTPGTSIGDVYLATTAGGTFVVNSIAGQDLAGQLGIAIGAAPADALPIICPKILPFYYLDFVSPQLTYNQDLKDNSTSFLVRDVIYRWVFAYDNVPMPTDKYGYPIFQGYKAFVARRYLAYPKQVNWDPTMPIGQLSFQVYTSGGDILDAGALGGEFEYQMSMLVSEN